MGKNLTSSLGRALAEVRHGAPPFPRIHGANRALHGIEDQTLALIGVMFLLMIALCVGYISGNIIAGAVAAVVMLIVGFFFATVSGSLVGMSRVVQ